MTRREETFEMWCLRALFALLALGGVAVLWSAL